MPLRPCHTQELPGYQGPVGGEGARTLSACQGSGFLSASHLAGCDSGQASNARYGYRNQVPSLPRADLPGAGAGVSSQASPCVPWLDEAVPASPRQGGGQGHLGIASAAECWAPRQAHHSNYPGEGVCSSAVLGWSPRVSSYPLELSAGLGKCAPPHPSDGKMGWREAGSQGKAPQALPGPP